MMYDIIVVGAGPAGLSAAIYGARSSKKVLVLEAKNYGGQIINTLDIENYPANNHISGFDLATKMYEQAKDLGAIIKFEKVIEIKNNSKYKEVITTNNKYKCKSLILATGSENRKLGLDNEDKLLGKGVSYCATCDGSFHKGKTVAVVGGGNAALEDALYLSDIAKKVYLIHRRDTFRGEESTLNKLKGKENIEFIYNSNVTNLNENNGVLESIIITDKEGNTKKLKVSAVFIAVGQVPENQNFAKTIKLNEKGYIVAKENCHTNRKGIFVAGDARTKELRQLVTATSDGAVAATEAIKFINNYTSH